MSCMLMTIGPRNLLLNEEKLNEPTKYETFVLQVGQETPQRLDPRDDDDQQRRTHHA